MPLSDSNKTDDNDNTVVALSDSNGAPVGTEINPLFSKVDFSDSANLDAFGRLRISEPYLMFESIQKYNNQPLLWDTSTSGTGAATFVANESCTNMVVGTASGDSVIRQTKRYIKYTPGRSQLILLTGNFGGKKTNVRQRIGYFDSQNGLFFECDGTDLKVVQRSYASGQAVDTAVTQANWNIDKLDGTGASGITLDVSKANIFFIDLEWLGVGRTRFGAVVDGKVIYCHAFNNANNVTTVYMTTAKLPCRYEISNTGTSASSTTMKQICSVVSSEGGAPTGGIIRSVDMGAGNNAFKNASSGVRTPLLTIRLNASYIQASLQPLNYMIMTSNNTNFKYEFVINGTLTGASYSNVDGYAQVDTEATAISGGTVVDSGYISGAYSRLADSDLSTILTWLATNLAQTSDTFSIVITPFANTTAVAQFSYREII